MDVLVATSFTFETTVRSILFAIPVATLSSLILVLDLAALESTLVPVFDAVCVVIILVPTAGLPEFFTLLAALVLLVFLTGFGGASLVATVFAAPAVTFFADTDFTADLATGFFGALFTAVLAGFATTLLVFAATFTADFPLSPVLFTALLGALFVILAVLPATALAAGFPLARLAGFALAAAAGLFAAFLAAPTLFVVDFLVTVALIALILKELPDACFCRCIQPHKASSAILLPNGYLLTLNPRQFIPNIASVRE